MCSWWMRCRSIRKKMEIISFRKVITPVFSGATDHKTHGSDHTTDFESRISKKKVSKLLGLILKSVIKRTITQITSIDEQPTTYNYK